MDTISSEPASPRKHISIWAILVMTVLVAGAILAYWLLPQSTPASNTQANHPRLAPPKVRLVLYATGLPHSTGIAATGEPADTRLFVLDRDGLVRIVASDGSIDPTPFLDIHDRVLSSGEMGLLGLAFSPHYAKDGTFFVNYVDKSQETIIARYRVSANPNQADSSSEQILLTLKQPYTNHKGGDLQFGPDGYLYAALGDGGSGGDPQDRAQNLAVWFGKILRLDVRTVPYKIPSTNPFINQPGKAPEVWDYGLRNPWRISFDRQSHDLYIADVGQDKMEEIDVEPAASKGGNNYGWRCYEGTLDYNLTGCQAKAQYILPVAEYDHSSGRCSITGGYVYRGKKYQALEGKYFYGDYCSGDLFWLQKHDNTWQTATALKSPYNITTFGQDNAGELYLADFTTGSLYQIEDVANPPENL